jgi:hypothetical protein
MTLYWNKMRKPDSKTELQLIEVKGNIVYKQQTPE